MLKSTMVPSLRFARPLVAVKKAGLLKNRQQPRTVELQRFSVGYFVLDY